MALPSAEREIQKEKDDCIPIPGMYVALFAVLCAIVALITVVWKAYDEPTPPGAVQVTLDSAK